jgi:hypothetical protein
LNLVVKLITQERLGILRGAYVVDLSQPADNGPIELSSDSGDGGILSDGQDLDPGMQAQKKQKVRCLTFSF